MKPNDISNIRITILGAFAFKTMDTGGQPVKTRELYYALIDKFGNDKVKYVDTYGWKNEPVKFFSKVIKAVLWSNRCIMLPAENGLRLFSLLLCGLKGRHRKIYYDVIGGWLVNLVKKDQGIKNRLLRFDGIWVETNTMKKRLEEIGFNKVFLLKNFKNLTIVNSRQNMVVESIPFKVCIFSRVMKEKGISDAISTISKINTENGQIIYHLDIYGPIAPQYSKEFGSLLDLHKDYVSYKGIVDPLDSVNSLRNYFALLFPTQFYTEGIPGTIIDAYSAGIPVIASRWESWNDVIEDYKTGVSYKFGDIEDFYNVMQRAWQNPQSIFEMKTNCLKEAIKYSREEAVEVLGSLLEAKELK